MSKISARSPQRVLFVGSKEIGLRVLQFLHESYSDLLIGVLTCDDRNDARSVYGEFLEYCRSQSIELAVAANRRDADAHVMRLVPDLCIVVGWYWLIDRALLEAVSHGWVGIHNSLLPQYRGGSPLVWQIINGESRVGFSIFSFTPGMDDGPVWAQGSIPVSSDENVREVLDKLEKVTLSTLRTVIPGLLAGTVVPSLQSEQHATYCSQRFPDDGLIDWRLPARTIHDFIRAQSDPYPGAFTRMRGKKLIVWSSRPFEARYDGVPGRVARTGPGGTIVCCGQATALWLGRVQTEGYDGSSEGLIRSNSLRLGD